MNQRAAIFELICITFLLLLGITLSNLNIANSGILAVAGLLSLFFVTSHYRALFSVFAFDRKSTLVPISNSHRSEP